MADANLDIRVTSKGIKEAQLALQKLGINADKAEEAVKQYKEETKKNEKAQNQYRKQQEKATTQVSKAAQVHKQARGGFRAMRGATQQLSFQLQDVAVQAQSGTAGLTILAQQGPQILSVFGPGGAVVGALVAFGALIGGVLVSAFKDSETGSDALERALGRLKTQVDETENSAFQLSKRILEFAQVSEAAAQAELIAGLKDTRIALRETKAQFEALVSDQIGQDIQDVASELKRLRSQDPLVDEKLIKATETYSDELGVVNVTLDELSDKLGISKEQALAFVDSAAQLDQNNIKSYSDFRAVIDGIQSSTRDLSPVFAVLRRDLIKEEVQLRSLTDQAGILRQARRDLSEQGIAGLRDLVDPSAEMDRHNALVAAIDDKIAAEGRLQSIVVQNRREMHASLDAEIKQREKAEEQKQGLLEKTQRTLSTLYSATSPAVLSFARQQQSMLEILQEANDKKLLSDEGLANAKKLLQEDLTAFMLAEEQKREQNEIAQHARSMQREADRLYNNLSAMEKWYVATEQALNNIGFLQVQLAQSFEQNLGGAIEGLLTGTMNLKEAFKAFAADMLKSFLSMMAQMLAKQIAFSLIGGGVEQAGRASLAAYQGAIGQAKVAEAAMNAYVSTLAIPVVGPALAPGAAATAAGVAQGLAGVNTALNIAAASIPAGPRALGGQVRGGESYLVGERGPELLTMGGSGRVSSNDQLKKAMGGGEGITIVNNVDARGADASVDVKIRKAMQETAATTIETIRDLSRRRRFV